jgi:hypothetical protein
VQKLSMAASFKPKVPWECFFHPEDLGTGIISSSTYIVYGFIGFNRYFSIEEVGLNKVQVLVT